MSLTILFCPNLLATSWCTPTFFALPKARPLANRMGLVPKTDHERGRENQELNFDKNFGVSQKLCRSKLPKTLLLTPLSGAIFLRPLSKRRRPSFNTTPRQLCHSLFCSVRACRRRAGARQHFCVGPKRARSQIGWRWFRNRS